MTAYYQCFAKDCKNSTTTTSGIRFFVFPYNKEKRQVWLALCGKSEVIDDHIEEYTPKALCANHFEDDQYTDDNKSFLRLSAVPTIFSFSSSIQTKEEQVESADKEVTLYDPDKPNEKEKEKEKEKEVVKEKEKEKEKEKNVPSTSKSPIASVSSPAGIPGGKVISTQVTASGGVKKLISVPRHIFEAMQKQGKIKSTTSSVNQKQVSYMRVAVNTGTPAEKRTIPQEVAGQKKFILIKPGTSSGPMPMLQPSKTVTTPSETIQKADGIKTFVKTNIQVKPINQMLSQVPPSTSVASSHLVQVKASKPAAVSAAQPARSLLQIAPKTNSPQVLQPSHNKRKQNLTEIRAEAPSVTVSQVAPDLPIPPKQIDFKSFSFLSLKPLGWQDWPVALEVFIPAATQLLANYTKMFPRRDRLDIETTLHLAAHYKYLNNDSRAHVRARVHHFLKILQLEQQKRVKEGTAEDSENIAAQEKNTEKA